MKNLISLIVSSCILMSSSLSYGKESPKITAPDKTGFHDVCPGLFKIADDFAKECLEKARSKEYLRYPYPKMGGIPYKVKNYVYFRAIDSGSHFGLGCSLEDKRNIMFLGIFYSAKSSNFAIANTLPIFQAIGAGRYITLKKDNTENSELIKFIAVRQFQTDFIKPVISVGENDIKNCENRELPYRKIINSEGKVYISKTQTKDGHATIQSCDTAELPLCSGEYINVFPSSDERIIFEEGYSDLFITAGGELLIRKSNYDRACNNPKNRDFIKEICDLNSK